MPVYEFQCNQCKQRVSLFVRKMSDSAVFNCPVCDGEDMTRLFSNFAYHRSVKSVHEESGDVDSAGADFYKDPRNIGRWTESRFQEMGMEVPSNVQQMIQAAREGELPAPIKDLQPGLSEV